MARSVIVVHVARFAVVAAVAVAACDGKVNHLGDGRTDGGGTCTRGQVNADEVLWIGDSWILVPGSQRSRVRDLARMAGALGPSEDYVNGAAAAAFMTDIANQYATRQAGATKVKVVLMDGGTWDTLVGSGSAASVTSAASAFSQFLGRVAADGTVQHLIYFLPPELPAIPGVAALRPLVQQACAQSTAPCHFLDLRDVWAGHPEYTDPATGGILPNDAGAIALADALWAIMQAECVAQ
jgi:hypothetical protein